MHPRRLLATIALGTAGLVALGGVLPAGAVNDDHDRRVVSANPAQTTPHIMDGAVLSITQVGNRVVVGGTFSRVSPPGTYGDPSDDLTRHGIVAFDATTGAIDTRFNPDLGAGGTARAVDTDGTHVYVGGRFASVGGDSAIKRVVKLTAAGSVVRRFAAVPNREVTDLVVRGDRVYVSGSFTSVSTPGGRHSRRALAALWRGTGAVVRGFDVGFTGVYDTRTIGNGGVTGIRRFDVSADGSRLVAVGNFRRVAGKPRSQVAVLNTSRAPATVTSWSTNRFDRFHNRCAIKFNTFTRDVDFAPRGKYFVVTSTGAFAGGARAGTLCDTVTRWQTASRGNHPEWVAYTGGDTTWGVAVTGGAVYVGGHMRWLNNPFRGDREGAGAVPRAGIAALDPANGLPLSWNPGRSPRGVGAQALFATSGGLWIGSDTDRIAGETHARIAFMPLAGGTSTARAPRTTLPNDVFLAQARSPRGVLLRRSVRGNGVPSGRSSLVDASIDWSRVRGGFLIGDVLYHGWRNGAFFRRSFDTAEGRPGPSEPVDLRPDPRDGSRVPFPIGRVTGMFFDPGKHRIYYTLSGHARLYYRYFTPESGVVGAQTFVASRRGVSFAHVRGMTLAAGKILYGSRSGLLRRVSFAGGRVTGVPRVLSRGRGWRARALLTPTG